MYFPSAGFVPVAEFDSSKPIFIGFGLTTNEVSLLFALQPEYGFRISAASESGEPVEPTSNGAEYGRKFDVLKGYEKEAINPLYGFGRPPHWVRIGPTCDKPMIASFQQALGLGLVLGA